ncbi:Cep120 protein-domain-containing protein [Gamsiella multidivaricata]|uniref:Cep120 protein-domain-containing protein n=1 Tax=Gamsiella multidivaricata TaxID=101098 RepID=UPI00221F5014|nr:Cep120 protein-domain-containing protein [Gamsiella multidivaricata]KAI7831657.1 Cep120 protein-domain-containing protein [Gamsiella multidivaricata]
MTSPTPRYTILVTIVEGRYFIRDPDCQLLVQCQFNDALFIENPETNSHSYPEVLSTDPVEQTPYPIWDTELAWDLDAEVLDILRIERASLKLNCFSINQKTNEEESLGHVILDLSSAFEPESAEEQWTTLTGSDTAGFRGLQPELKIAFTIDDGISEVTPTIDTLLTSIESTSGSEDVEHLEQHQKRLSKAMLHGLEEEDETEDQYEDDDQDAHVPSVGDKSFYHSRDDDHDIDVPEFDADESMQMDIPVDIGEALIPTEVNDKGFLQLGLGRDFFIFTITIQTARNMGSLVERYAASQDKGVKAVEKGLYLYYSFLGNNVATQFLSNAAEGTPIEEIALRLKSSMESMYQHFRDGEELVINLCHEANLIGTATIPLAVILLHGTANLFHASPQFYPFQAALQSNEMGSKPSPSEIAFIQVGMHVTRDLNTLSVPSTPAIRRSSQGSSPRRIIRPPGIEVDMSRNVASSSSSRSPRRHDYKFSIELTSFKSLSRNLSNVSLRYNYRPFGPKSTQPPVSVSRLVPTSLPDARRTFQLCQTPEALRNQLKTPLVVEVWCQHPETHQNVLHASGQIHLIDILDEGASPSSEGRIQRLQSSFVVVLEGGSNPVGEIQFACSLEDLGEYFDSQQSEILSTTPIHSMELHHQHHSRGISDDLASSGPEPQYGFHPRGSSYEVMSSEQDDDRSQRHQHPVSHFAEGYSDHDRMETSATPGRNSQRPVSVRLSQVRHLSQAHQNSHPHHHHPYGKPSSPSGKNDPPMDYQMALKQQLAKQVELNRQVEYDLLRRSPISSLPHSLQQTLQADKSTRPSTTLDMFDSKDNAEDMIAQQAKQKMKDLKALDYQVQKQLIALEFRERKLLRAEEALQRQQTNFQKVLDRHGYSQGAFQHPDQPFVMQKSSSAANGNGNQSMMGSNPAPQDFFLLQDRFRALQRQNQLLEAEFNQYRQEHPAHINMTSVNNLHQTIAELESTNSKLMNDVTFANNYKEHYKALWTHSLQEIASMRQDLQMGMEIKMMQQFNEVDQLKLMGMTRAEADHGQDRIILRGIKTELEMLQHQMQPLFPDDDMSWEQQSQHSQQQQQQKSHQEAPMRGSGRHEHRGSRDDDSEDSDDHSQYGHRRGLQQQQFPFGQSQQRHQQTQQQRQQTQQQYRGGQQQQFGGMTKSGYEPFPSSAQRGGAGGNGGGKFQGSLESLIESVSSSSNNNNNNQMNSSSSSNIGLGRYAQANMATNLSLQEDDDEEHEDTLVDNTMLRSMMGNGHGSAPFGQGPQNQQGGKFHGGSMMGPFSNTQHIHS